MLAKSSGLGTDISDEFQVRIFKVIIPLSLANIKDVLQVLLVMIANNY